MAAPFLRTAQLALQSIFALTFHVMAGLVPAIHVLLIAKKVVDARHKAGHDELEVLRRKDEPNQPATPGCIALTAAAIPSGSPTGSEHIWPTQMNAALAGPLLILACAG